MSVMREYYRSALIGNWKSVGCHGNCHINNHQTLKSGQKGCSCHIDDISRASHIKSHHCIDPARSGSGLGSIPVEIVSLRIRSCSDTKGAENPLAEFISAKLANTGRVLELVGAVYDCQGVASGATVGHGISSCRLATVATAKLAREKARQ
ncbi:hypothetical protein RRG08_020936 [Elysia crispata]|uniref:Uncharacterized protein n=1 Tax=Elysia crispata TaxID=231223 RepID=A0AAE1A986_9GAST|nr:hypothetical protein RRG08_020936 [Elysia crispata]